MNVALSCSTFWRCMEFIKCYVSRKNNFFSCGNEQAVWLFLFIAGNNTFSFSSAKLSILVLVWYMYVDFTSKYSEADKSGYCNGAFLWCPVMWINTDAYLILQIASCAHQLSLRRLGEVISIMSPFLRAVSSDDRFSASGEYGYVVWWVFFNHFPSYVFTHDEFKPYCTEKDCTSC